MKILPVFICEDDMTQLNFLKLTINNHIIINEMHIAIKLISTDPMDILIYLEKNSVSQGIYFLDINLGSTISGIELAQSVRERDPLGKIVFITTYDEMAPIILQKRIEPLAYIVKAQNLNDLKRQVVECLELSYRRYIGGLTTQKKLFTFTIAKKKFNIDILSVLFIESAVTPHRLILYTDDNQYEFYGKLSDYERDYKELYRCHKAYLINPQKIESVDYKTREIFFPKELSCYFSAIKKSQLKELIL